MKLCPQCLECTLSTDDVNNARYVALGVAVCSLECHAEAYRLNTDIDGERELPFYSI